MRILGSYLATALLCAFAAGGVSAQTPPTPTEILEAWSSSPHADATAKAFRYWDGAGEIPGTCAVCHSTTGAVDYLASPMLTPGIIDHPVPTGTTIECAACHNRGADALAGVIFPSGEVVGAGASAICTVCHQGRNSSVQVDAAVQALGDDEMSPALGFINIHYATAGATQLGGAVRGGYQYDGRSYAGPFQHVPGLDTCVDCHDAHDTQVLLEDCVACHEGASDFRAIRMTTLDILGRGNATEGISVVIDDLHGRLGAAIVAYSREVSGKPIVYSDAAFPYFFNDLDENGTADPAEAIFPNRYQSWSPRLLRAAYNYQFVAKDHGAFTHNPHYVLQLMFDSLEDLGKVASADTVGLVRP